jgi:hypothetical protein
MWNKSVCKPLRNSEGRREKWIRAAGVAPKKRANVRLSVLSVPLKKKGKKRKETPFFLLNLRKRRFGISSSQKSSNTVLFVASKPTRAARSITKKFISEVKNEQPQNDCTRAR